LFSQLRNASADIIVSLTPASQQVIVGQNAVFNIFIRSTTPGQAIDGLSLNLLAGSGDGTGGIFTAGTSDFFEGNPNAWSFDSPEGQAFFAAFVDDSNTLGITDELLGQVTLSTSGILPGTYSVTFDPSAFEAGDPDFNSIPTSADPVLGSAQYIVAVPEPASMVVLGLSGMACVCLRTRRNKKLATTN
jgi:hypothetical protein